MNRYMCRDPKQIKFAPLNRDTEHTAEELMTIFEVSLNETHG
jgi:phenylalanyl-tRNA synthetase beta chain